MHLFVFFSLSPSLDSVLDGIFIFNSCNAHINIVPVVYLMFIVIMDIYFDSSPRSIGTYFLFHFIFYGSLPKKCAFSWSIFQVCGSYRIFNRNNAIACHRDFAFVSWHCSLFPNHLCQYSRSTHERNPFLNEIFYVHIETKIMHVFFFLSNLDASQRTNLTLACHARWTKQQREFIAFFVIRIKIY